MTRPKLILTGQNLTSAELYRFVNSPDSTVEIDSRALKDIERGHRFLEANRQEGIIYGVNTGFGPMASHVIGSNDVLNLQRNLIRSHAAGMGQPIAEKYSLAAMIVRLNTLAQGHSGISVELAKRLEFFINERIIPLIPEHGAVGTSGDLVQLAHIALALIGEGEVFYKGGQRLMVEVVRELNLPSYALKPKEGLALINGTSVMSAIAALLSVEAEKLINHEIRLGALGLELVNGFTDSFSAELHAFRPHPGQAWVAGELRSILGSSKLLRDRRMLTRGQVDRQPDAVKKINETVQEVYSFRCLAQIIGPIYEAAQKLRQVVDIEINSVTDNPIVDWKNEQFLHGGNFHGDYVAHAVDQLKMAIVKLSMLAERRINFFLNAKVNESYPPFLNLGQPGLTLALQGLQFVATSTTAQNQTLAYPQYVHSIPTNGDNQDIVSMGTDAALLFAKVIENSYLVQAIELVTLAQAVDCLKVEDQLSETTALLYKGLRRIFPPVIEDRTMAPELRAVVESLITHASD
jgi:histidine ammonia-lyase